MTPLTRAVSLVALAVAIGYAIVIAPPVAILGAVAVPAVVLASRYRRLGLIAILATGFLAVGNLSGTQSQGASLLRLGAIPFVVLLLFSSLRRNAGAPIISDWTVVRRLIVFGAGMSMTIGWTASRGLTVRGTVGLALGIASVWAITMAFSHNELERAFSFVAGWVAVSMFVAYAISSSGSLAGRARGIFGNPNAVGVAVTLLLPWLMTGGRRRLPMAAAAIAVLARSGSRAGLLAALVEILLLISRSGARRRVWMLLAGGVLVAVLLVAVLSEQRHAGSSIFRTENSRSTTWSQALHRAGDRAPLGWGLGADPGETASSYIKLVVEAGPLGVLLAIPLLGLAISAVRRGRGAASVAVAGGLVNAGFESWLFVGGSVFFTLFWVQVALALVVVPRAAARQPAAAISPS